LTRASDARRCITLAAHASVAAITHCDALHARLSSVAARIVLISPAVSPATTTEASSMATKKAAKKKPAKKAKKVA
jgi:hypothetical protein